MWRRVEWVVCQMLSHKYHRPLTPFQMLILYLRCMNHKLSLSVTRLSSLVCRLDMYSLSLENISLSYYACAQSFRKYCAGPPHLSFTLLHRWIVLMPSWRSKAQEMDIQRRIQCIEDCQPTIRPCVFIPASCQRQQ